MDLCLTVLYTFRIDIITPWRLTFGFRSEQSLTVRGGKSTDFIIGLGLESFTKVLIIVNETKRITTSI